MAELIYNEAKGDWEYRQMLRSPFIDYCNGRFFITFQAFHNKSVFGAIVGERCVLNELGEAIRAAWLEEPQHVAGLKLDEFVVMPNHFHAIVEYNAVEAWPPGPADVGPPRPACYSRDPHAHDLPYVVGLFKSYTTHIYLKLKSEGRCIDIGSHLWQSSFYDELIRNDEQYRATVRYIRNNPMHWNSDRFGAVTSYAEGNLQLLECEYVAYLSSEGRLPEAGLPMKCYAAGRSGPAATVEAGSPCPADAGSPRPAATIISTFTSYYERQVLAHCIANHRRFIWVCPGGIGPEALQMTSAAREAHQALLISPVSPGTGVNKQRANWCNQFIVKNAQSIWVGRLRAGGSLEAILKELRPKS